MISLDERENLKNKITTYLLLLSIITSSFMTGCTKDENITNDNSGMAIESSSEQNEGLLTGNESSESSTVNSEVYNTSSEATLYFINTGNSDAILIEQNKEFALIDGGDNDDEQLLVNYLKKTKC